LCFNVYAPTCPRDTIIGLPDEWFLYAYEPDFIQGLPKKNAKKKLAHFKFHYTDAVISLINCTFGDYVDD
jgi:hypothetical protein